VSLDRIERLNEFSADLESCAGTVAVASDAKGAIAKSFDLFVQDGRIAATLRGLSPEDNVARALDAVRALK
jgi:hypothetical protein